MRSVLLGTVAAPLMGIAPPSESCNTRGEGLPLVAGASDFGEQHPNPKKWTTEITRLAEPGDLLICIRATIGDLNFADRQYVLGRGVAGLRLNADQVDGRYLRHVLAHRKSDLERLGTGSTFLAVRREDLEKFPIPFPVLTEQKRIAEVLDRAESLLTQRRSALALLDTLTQSTFLQFFVKPNGRRWPMVTVGEAGRVQLGRQRAPKYQTGRYTRPYLRVANVFEDRIDLSDLLSMDFDDDDFAAYRLQHGDILLNEGQSTELVGRPAMWRDELDGCCFQNTLVRFQAYRQRAIPEYALALFLYYFRTGEFAKISSKTSNVAHLGAGRFAAMPFPLPPLSLQKEFAERIARIEKLKAAQRASLAELDALFASLQHQAFRGEL